MHKYQTIIHWSDEDQVLVAEIQELAGYMAHGNTPEAELAQAQEAIQLWIDTARVRQPHPRAQRPPPHADAARKGLRGRILRKVYSLGSETTHHDGGEVRRI